MIELLAAAFLLGFLGSMHCVGMCGGLVSALSMSRPHIWWAGLLSYQAGRISVYSFLGLVVGMAGVVLHQAPWFSEMQQGITIFAGILMMIFGANLAGWLPDPLVNIMATFSKIIGLQRWIYAASTSRMPMSWLMVGLFNGLLPCGLVYAALVFSLTAHDVILSTAMMFSFGLGTVPAMIFVPIVLKKVSPKIRGIILKGAAVLLILFGVLTMLRGSAWMHSLHGQHQHHGASSQSIPQDMDMSEMDMPNMLPHAQP